MPRYAYVNGGFYRHRDARIHIEDRGYQFADGVYEVCLVVDGALWDWAGHAARWRRSLTELQIAEPVGEGPMVRIITQLLARNRLRSALVYSQATRGVAPRNHAFPPASVKPALTMTARAFSLSQSDATAARGVRVITAPDIRWGRVDIKSVSLLPNVLAKDVARRAGAFEAILVRERNITEGSSSNFWIVDQAGRLRTHPKGTSILGGITRETVLECARNRQIIVDETPFTVDEALTAREAFLTSATGLVMPVVQIDDTPIGKSGPGETTRTLRCDYIDLCRRRSRFVLKPLQ